MRVVGEMEGMKWELVERCREWRGNGRSMSVSEWKGVRSELLVAGET